MNHSPSGSLLLSKAIPGFINYITAEGLALRTIDSHERLLNKWLEHNEDQEIGKITANPEVRRAWAAQGTTAMTMGVDEFTRYMNDDITKWARIVKFSGAKAE